MILGWSNQALGGGGGYTLINSGIFMELPTLRAHKIPLGMIRKKSKREYFSGLVFMSINCMTVTI